MKSRRELARDISEAFATAPRSRGTRAIRSAGRAHDANRSAAQGWRPLGGDGEPWPVWLRNARTACGIYAIRDKRTKRVLYVGSSERRLYDTISRHMQKWSRSKKFWRGAYGRARETSHDPGMTYARGDVEVMVKLTSCDKRLAEETKAIARLRPRDNLVSDPSGELESAPF